VASSLQGLAFVRRNQRKLAEAEALHREALAMRRKLLGNDHPQVANSLVNLAEALDMQGRFAESEPVLREALAIRRKAFGSAWSVTARLGVALTRQGKLTEAEALLRQAAEHADAQTLNELAWELATSSDPKLRDGPSAVTLAEKAVARTNRTNPNIMDTLAAAYAEAGQFTNAIRVQQGAIALLQNEQQKKDSASRLKLYESGIPYHNPALLAQQSTALLANGKFAEAEPLARECLAIREKQNSDDWLTFNARSLLGGSLLGQKKHAEAEPLLLAAYEGMKQHEARIPTNGRPRLKETLQRLVQLYDATARPDQAAQWKQKLAEFTKAEAEKLPGEPPR
jgi:tetratricopeptide (TPR) repeat protein